MKYKKSELLEIIDANGDLIGKNDVPATGADLETQASNTTDYNQKIGTQPYRYDMLGRFGFFAPFMEGKEEQTETFLNELTGLMHNRFVDLTNYYIKHPNMLKPDNRKAKEESVGHNEECEKRDIEWAKEVMKVVEKHFGKEPEIIDEASVVEDKVVDKRTEDEISNRSEDKEIREKKLEKIAGLISKLERNDKDKLKNLLEAAEKKEETNFSSNEKKEINSFVSSYKGNFKDEDIHKLAEKLGLDIPEVEEFIYGIARKGLKK
jgi:uncharacterized protein YdiU (UPF0061 family)